MFVSVIFFFNDTATTEIYTLSLHDALPICRAAEDAPAQERLDGPREVVVERDQRDVRARVRVVDREHLARSEEHTSELQSRQYLVCRLLLEKKKQFNPSRTTHSNIVIYIHQ